ncbi:LYR motif-containing protein 4 isoform X1 [Megalobrama amblycephala]|uniref:LYR motif-containing protein 4 isoform X1 n=1 Tax=Megalobrama amblycephala TaxID=75352 RepID=UPI0020145C54|nr:LYR motif-containing protein 4 isoform X1 [Megalobrama amblycephala]
MAASGREHVLSLYRLLLKESKKFPSYNYRTYALRRVRDAFRENRTVEDPKVVEELLNRARESLAIIQRQSSMLPNTLNCWSKTSSGNMIHTGQLL